MRGMMRSYHRTGRTISLVAAVCALLVIAVAGPAMAQPHEWSTVASCRLQGSWLAEVDIGGRFFAQYAAGANANSGALTLVWILFDPTLFGNFPTAVRLTQAAGGWERHGQSYDYTWVAYGLDSAGIPVYAIKGSGTGTFQGCDTIAFDWVLDVYAGPDFDPIFGDPVTCLSGFGTKVRIPVERASCP
jgi:hypothetical protein